jgi:hypothetical protein
MDVFWQLQIQYAFRLLYTEHRVIMPASMVGNYALLQFECVSTVTVYETLFEVNFALLVHFCTT